MKDEEKDALAARLAGSSNPELHAKLGEWGERKAKLVEMGRATLTDVNLANPSRVTLETIEAKLDRILEILERTDQKA